MGFGALALGSAFGLFLAPGGRPRFFSGTWGSETSAAQGAPVAADGDDTPKSEWVELIESLRLDIERLKGAPARAPAAAAPATGEAATTGGTAATVKRRAGKKRQPVQDEWGFFDPEQCGFAALLAKLDEITDAPEESGSRPH